MNQIFYLKTCDTCTRILKDIPLDRFELIEIKSNPMTELQLEAIFQYSNNYEALFNKRAKKYHAQGLKEQDLTEADFKRLLLEEYTFLKRPVIVYNNELFVGNSKKTIDNLQEKLKL